ncbi:MAG: hypothetical protein RL761_725, partial [Pseudomonadota bacterium]
SLIGGLICFAEFLFNLDYQVLE